LAGKTVRCKGCGQTFKVPGQHVEPVVEVATEEPEMQPAAAPAAVASLPEEEDFVAEAVEDEEPLAAAVEDEDMEAAAVVADEAPETTEEEPPAEAKKAGKGKKAKGPRKPLPVKWLAIGGGGALVLILILVGVYFMFLSGPSTPAKSAPKGGGKSSNPPVAGNKGSTKGGPKAAQSNADPNEPPDDPSKELALPGDSPVSYVTHVKPLINRYCSRCHGAKMPKAGINLTTYEGIMKAKRKQPLVVAGDPDKSLLVLAVEPNANREMPPPKEKQPTDDEKKILRKWVSEGATNDSAKSGALPAVDTLQPFVSENQSWRVALLPLPSQMLVIGIQRWALASVADSGAFGNPLHLSRQSQEQLHFHLR
jgi:hypothetical protein